LPDGHTVLYIEENLARITLMEEKSSRTDIEFQGAPRCSAFINIL